MAHSTSLLSSSFMTPEQKTDISVTVTVQTVSTTDHYLPQRLTPTSH